MYGGIGVSASSLHRESTDSLIFERCHQSAELLYLSSLVGRIIINTSIIPFME